MNAFWLFAATFDPPLTVFLTVTNILLGLLVLGCIVLVIRVLFREVMMRLRTRSLTVTELGVTMTDGGRPAPEEGHLSVTQTGKIEPADDHTPPVTPSPR
ncbi:MAG TPA: hypothetical protein VL221_14905 [Bacteroidota bacterium]|nr:hypothetical protein [Bacteroidota bacterium]